MQLKISSPAKTIFEGEIKEIILPTEIGEVKILPGHTPMVTVLKPGIINLIPTEKVSSNDFIVGRNNSVSLSIGKGMAFVDGKVVKVVISSATTIPTESIKELESKKLKIEEKIKSLRKSGSLEEIERSLIQLDKINADIRLKNLKD
ncbi:MAG TPA: F0F1 ATP synthase subunit epsilon [Candidatus Absconditabacterales bacterium]|nr:F0F1 ATP synthase subunit epsilon [Candidatus Absconditabacterales bacterium]HRU50492.1 F0F1 ATP synthase subunit epsilon [Candidatus Absconditabacterales bacterium]